MYLLGIDLGSSSVKVSILDAETGKCSASSYYPEDEMSILATHPGWAEQEPELWWENTKRAIRSTISNSNINPINIKAIGISYQMHGLVCIDKNQKVLRPSIIWCDSRAVEIGKQAFKSIGEKICLDNLLNSPGNFTASKLKWIKDNEPDIYKRIDKIMLPGDYLAMKMTGNISTTYSGLSEGILWNFKNNSVADILLDYYGIDKSILPEQLNSFAEHGKLTKKSAEELGLKEDLIIAYKAGDQPNNAFSLNVLHAGEIAATAGTSGVVYGISDKIKYDPQSRVNTFLHVNHSTDKPRLGVLLCINGTGILNSWLKTNIASGLSYEEMNKLASKVKEGSDGLIVLPFGNGAERVLGNKNTGGHIFNMNFNNHSQAHLYRAAQEGIVFAFKYGMDIMSESGINPKTIRAGLVNMFLSKIFRETLSKITGISVDLYDTDGSTGAARAAGIGSGIYNSFPEAFENLQKLTTIEPANDNDKLNEVYQDWKNKLENIINNE